MLGQDIGNAIEGNSEQGMAREVLARPDLGTAPHEETCFATFDPECVVFEMLERHAKA